MESDNKHISKTGFKTPENYFENLEDKVLQNLNKKQPKIYKFEKEYTAGFETPTDYFDNLETKIFRKLEIDQKSSVDSGFKVPMGYFDQLEKRVLEVSLEKKKNPKVIPLFTTKKLVYFSSVAAAIALVISIANISFPKDDTDFSSLDIADIQDYMDDEAGVFGDIEITAALISEKTDLSVDTYNTLELNNDSVIEYLEIEGIEDDIMYTN